MFRSAGTCVDGGLLPSSDRSQAEDQSTPIDVTVYGLEFQGSMLGRVLGQNAIHFAEWLFGLEVSISSWVVRLRFCRAPFSLPARKGKQRCPAIDRNM